jgi:hypothetical protein
MDPVAARKLKTVLCLHNLECADEMQVHSVGADELPRATKLRVRVHSDSHASVEIDEIYVLLPRMLVEALVESLGVVLDAGTVPA